MFSPPTFPFPFYPFFPLVVKLFGLSFSPCPSDSLRSLCGQFGAPYSLTISNSQELRRKRCYGSILKTKIHHDEINTLFSLVRIAELQNSGIANSFTEVLTHCTKKMGCKAANKAIKIAIPIFALSGEKNWCEVWPSCISLTPSSKEIDREDWNGIM